MSTRPQALFERPPASVLMYLALAASCMASTVLAQTHKVTAPQPVTRAVAVYEWTGDLAKPTAARLVPVSLFIDGSLQDAGTFYARPIPLALLNGNIYSLEKAGIPQGNVTLEYARHLQTATGTGNGDVADLGWFGYGNFTPPPAPKKLPPLQPAHNPSTIVSSKDPDSQPRFSNTKSDKTGKSSTDSAPTLAKSTPKPSQTVPEPPADDPDRPHLSKSTPKPDESTPKPATNSTDTSPKDTKNDAPDTPDADRPTLRHRDPKQAEQDRKARNQSSVSTIPGTLANDPDRPTMKRGTPAGSEPAPTQLSGLPAALHQSAAVSDAVNREVHPFARDWSTPTEQAEVMAKLQALAQQKLADYTRLNNAAQQTISPAPKYTRPSRHHSVTLPLGSPTPQTLSAEQLSGYTLSYGGLPTFVYTAIAPPPTTTGITPPERYVTIVAQQLPSGEVQLALASVTDAAHLDRTPWLRLIDVVDPDAGHRASILFELRGQTTRQFALYRILSAKADQIFATAATE